jgi:3-isopropylmalate/(R)-2-methylmalate dehydratase small subunit
MKKSVRGRVQRFGHDITFEELRSILGISNPPASHSASDKRFGHERRPGIRTGDIILAGKNFGFGPFCEKTMDNLKLLNVPCIIAASFARSFYRGAINQGLAIVECAPAHDQIADGETVSVDFEKSEITCQEGPLIFPPYSEIISKILFSGGLLPHVKKMLGK